MSAHFTSCPACGAIGEIGNNCLFCGTTIQAKEGNVITNSRVVNIRTATPQEYANKIAIYHEIETKGNLAVVRIGDQYGVINLNGDLVYPLKKGNIDIISDLVISPELGKLHNLETLEEGFECPERAIDKNNCNRMHRLSDIATWKIDNVYTNNEGEIHRFNYCEELSENCFLLHKDNCCTFMFGVYWDNWNPNKRYCTIYIEKVKSVGKVIVYEDREYHPLKLINGKEILFPLRMYSGETHLDWLEKFNDNITKNLIQDKKKKQNSSTYKKEGNPKSFFSGIFKFSLWVILFFIIRWIWQLL